MRAGLCDSGLSPPYPRRPPAMRTLVLAACLEARGAMIVAETAEAVVRADPLQRPREMRRLGAPGFLALVDALEAASVPGLVPVDKLQRENKGIDAIFPIS